jgi:hypothetical protein
LLPHACDVIDDVAKPEGELNALARIHLAIADLMRQLETEDGIT